MANWFSKDGLLSTADLRRLVQAARDDREAREEPEIIARTPDSTRATADLSQRTPHANELARTVDEHIAAREAEARRKDEDARNKKIASGIAMKKEALSRMSINLSTFLANAPNELSAAAKKATDDSVLGERIRYIKFSLERYGYPFSYVGGYTINESEVRSLPEFKKLKSFCSKHGYSLNFVETGTHYVAGPYGVGGGNRWWEVRIGF